MIISTDRCTWEHGESRSGEVTYISAPDETGESQLVAIVCATFNEKTREEIAKLFCKALKEE